MKRLFHLSFTVIAVAGLAIFPSCKKDSTASPITASTPLQALINSDTTLTIFYAAVNRAGDNSLYAATDSVTVLIPTNTAFLSQGITTSTINAMPVAAVDSLLRYHFISSSANLTSGTYNTYNSQLGPAVYGYGNTDGTSNYFNGSLAAKQVLSGSNATVYELSAPLQIPAASAAQLIAADTSLTYFAEAVKHTNLSLVPATGWNTILAPTNTAFMAAGFSTLASIDSADINTLTNILQYHILPGQYFTNGFTGLSTVGSSEGNSVNLTFSNGMAQFTGTSNTTAAGITTANRIAGTNTIIQNINGVLMP
jgi:uncharacterized surface protein with fasciclin (FAS1) repeats